MDVYYTETDTDKCYISTLVLKYVYVYVHIYITLSRSQPIPTSSPPSRPPISGTVPAGQCSPLKTSADLYLCSLSSSPAPPPHTPTMCCMHVVGGHSPPTPSPHIQCQGQCSLVYRCAGMEVGSCSSTNHYFPLLSLYS